MRAQRAVTGLVDARRKRETEAVRLRAGDSAPPFGVRDLQGKTLTAGESFPMWLAFFRFASCPFCALRVREIIERYDDIEASPVRFIGVFPSSAENINKYILKFEPRFRIVSDPEERLYKKYRAETSWGAELRTALNLPRVVKALVAAPNNPLAYEGAFHRVPCEFLIHQGTIVHSYYAKTLDAGEQIDLMLEKASAL